MTKLVVGGLVVVVSVQVLALMLADRQFVVPACGAAVAVALITARWRMSHPAPAAQDMPADGTGTALQRWLTRTETLISWSESTRADWDRRLRPLLARQFELAAGTRKIKDPTAFQASGRMLFGPVLWAWVDPENISRTGSQEPGPGRATLDDILRRLEQL
ncbi:hypothetical protein [Mycobacterium sp. SMC-4]|uniref:hypothetical protein n=1 Tax=Mycobacterium sp. SMC-4 TaxID=2857059 RepID=UPI0021B48A3A|nr:hypothetical protein [Mycobacterium sp. SMC-4]UXA18316.1 hypothetical protein KXD98_00845 [Mycobacterium sp. SMC-4]